MVQQKLHMVNFQIIDLLQQSSQYEKSIIIYLFMTSRNNILRAKIQEIFSKGLVSMLWFKYIHLL